MTAIADFILANVAEVLAMLLIAASVIIAVQAIELKKK